ncbi:MAG: hypothetical protein HAW62_01565 [Endozoicomonadaceae bacterium]|nr:hypothetical protein [Endozoicomonadaceae bacterium]
MDSKIKNFFVIIFFVFVSMMSMANMMLDTLIQESRSIEQIPYQYLEKVHAQPKDKKLHFFCLLSAFDMKKMTPAKKNHIPTD